MRICIHSVCVSVDLYVAVSVSLVRAVSRHARAQKNESVGVMNVDMWSHMRELGICMQATSNKLRPSGRFIWAAWRSGLVEV